MSTALRRLSDPAIATKSDLFLSEAYVELGADAAELTNFQLPAGIKDELDFDRKQIADKMAALTKENPDELRAELSSVLAMGASVPEDIKDDIDLITEVGLPMVSAPVDVMNDVVSGTAHEPVGWIKTPSVVVSRGEEDGEGRAGGGQRFWRLRRRGSN